MEIALFQKARILMISVEAVSDSESLREFIDLPARLYAAFPEYQPPLRMDRALLLDPDQSAFWQQGNVCRYWIARADGRAVGRVSAQVGTAIPVGIAPGSGMFGCLDAIDDPAVVEALFVAAREWLAQQGCTGMFGPCTLDMNSEPGLLVAGFDEPPMAFSPWHPPYLGDLLDGLGFEKLHDLHNWRLDLSVPPERLPTGQSRLAGRIPGLRTRYPDRRTYARDIQVLCDIYNDGWRDNWGFVPLTPRDLAGLDQLMKLLVPRRAFKIVELDGTPVAVMLLIPNLFELMKGLAPRPGLAGWVRLIWRALTHRFKSGRIIVTGLSRHLQGTVVGGAIVAMLIDELIADCTALRGEWAEAGWVLESNTQLVRILERFGFRCNKTFRIYGQKL